MWIKWKYNDHGWPDFKELEIPDDLDGYETVEEYLIERNDLHIPTWSERYDSRRIHWEKLDLPVEEIKARQIRRLKSRITVCEAELTHLKRELTKYERT
jgi:hypothetical protein